MIMTVFILLIALGILGWGFYRAKPYGKLGLLSWLQSVALMLPWLLFFGLFAAGIDLNLAVVLFLLVVSTGLYIFLGNRLRSASQDPDLLEKLSTLETDRTFADDAIAPADSSSPSSAEALRKPDASNVIHPDGVPIPAEDLKAIQGIFGIDTFFCTETVPYQEGAIFKGNLRGEAKEAHARLSQSLAERLDDRYRLFLLRNKEEKPVVIVLPSSNDPKPTTSVQTGLAAVLFLATIATCLETAGLLLGFDLFSDLPRVGEALPIAIGLLITLVGHELGHRAIARQRQVRLSPPFFIPSWQIGSFGSLLRFESLLPNRSVLFDVAFAGPAVSGLLSLGMLIVGLILSTPSSLFQLPTEFFQGSILVGMLARIVLGSALQQPLVSIHPLVIVGWLGLVITAINLMPAGRLDGGRIIQAIYGRNVARWGTVATLVVLGFASLVNSLALYWAIVIFFLQREPERPSLEEISEPDDARAALGLLALFLMTATLLPVTPSLAGRLGIGG